MMAYAPFAWLALATSITASAQVVEVRPGPSRGQAPAPAARTLCGRALAATLREAISVALPVGFVLTDVSVGKACAVRGSGAWHVQVRLPDTLQRGRNSIITEVGTSPGPTTRLVADVALLTTAAPKAAAVVLRGSEVRVLVHSNNVTVQALAIAQESAGLGEPVQVLPAGGQRVVRGRVVDAQTVEVTL